MSGLVPKLGHVKWVLALRFTDAGHCEPVRGGNEHEVILPELNVGSRLDGERARSLEYHREKRVGVRSTVNAPRSRATRCLGEWQAWLKHGDNFG